MQNQLCRVCDEPAAGFHFGAFTCEGCKSFFGRTCNNQSVIAECKNNYRCVVDKKNRTSCKACRLRKCLMVGMSKSGSRYGRRSNWFKIHCLMQQSPGSSSSSGHDPPSVGAGHVWTSSSPNHDSTVTQDNHNKDSSFTNSSRSSSPSLNISLESVSKKSSLSSPSEGAVSPPRAESPPSMSQPLFSPCFPFYKLSPLLAAAHHHPLLAAANPLLLSLATVTQPQVSKTHLDLITEHTQLLAKFGAARSAALAAAAAVNTTADQRSPSPAAPSSSAAASSEAPMDLSVKFSATTCIIRPSSPTSPSSSSSSPDDEGIEVDIGDKSDSSIRQDNNNKSEAVLDLTVSS